MCCSMCVWRCGLSPRLWAFLCRPDDDIRGSFDDLPTGTCCGDRERCRPVTFSRASRECGTWDANKPLRCLGVDDGPREESSRKLQRVFLSKVGPLDAITSTEALPWSMSLRSLCHQVSPIEPGLALGDGRTWLETGLNRSTLEHSSSWHGDACLPWWLRRHVRSLLGAKTRLFLPYVVAPWVACGAIGAFAGAE